MYELSLFLVKYSVFNLFFCLFTCSFPFTRCKATIRSEWTFLCVCSYECNDPEWKTVLEQAKKTGLIQNIPLGREKESFIMFSLLGNKFVFSSKIEWQSLLDQGDVFGYGDCILLNL